MIRTTSRLLRHTLAGAFALATMSALGAGCLDRPVAPTIPQTTARVNEQVQQNAVDKIDLLFMIDNSASMADKQAVLGDAVPDLLDRLVNPGCVSDADRSTPSRGAPATTCPTGVVGRVRAHRRHPHRHHQLLARRSRLGRVRCDDQPSAAAPQRRPGPPPDPRRAAAPPRRGTATRAFSRGTRAGTKNSRPVKPTRRTSRRTFAEHGASAWAERLRLRVELEAWYRFLIDPQPPLNITASITPSGPQPAQLSGHRHALLDQRTDFLRPDSLVAVILLTDENDCSVIEDNGLAYLSINSPPAGQRGLDPERHEPLQEQPERSVLLQLRIATRRTPARGQLRHRPPTRTCDGQSPSRTRPTTSRCAASTRSASSASTSSTRSSATSTGSRSPDPGPRRDHGPEPALLPISSARAARAASRIRSSSLVFFAGIVGVPWQDIAVDPNGPHQGLQEQRRDRQRSKFGRCILGDPDGFARRSLPTDPLMIETPFPRQGTNPVTKEPLAGVSAAANANSINGHEYDTTQTTAARAATSSTRASSSSRCAARLLAARTNQFSCDCAEPGSQRAAAARSARTDAGDYSTTRFAPRATPACASSRC